VRGAWLDLVGRGRGPSNGAAQAAGARPSTFPDPAWERGGVAWE
jgi:hypothetical protein